MAGEGCFALKYPGCQLGFAFNHFVLVATLSCDSSLVRLCVLEGEAEIKKQMVPRQRMFLTLTSMSESRKALPECRKALGRAMPLCKTELPEVNSILSLF